MAVHASLYATCETEGVPPAPQSLPDPASALRPVCKYAEGLLRRSCGAVLTARRKKHPGVSASNAELDFVRPRCGIVYELKVRLLTCYHTAAAIVIVGGCGDAKPHLYRQAVPGPGARAQAMGACCKLG